MANTYPETVLGSQPLEMAPAGRHWSLWPKCLLVFLLALWIFDVSISLVIHHTSLQEKLTRRLETAFGRPVDVGSYDFTLWGGPTLEARTVTVGEDSRFGNEYFLRAESLRVRLRWGGLFRGRLELGTVALTAPSLNVVRNSAGDWNLAGWLPSPSQSLEVGPQRASVALRRIEVDGGRMNFKFEDEKLPFAFIGVEGVIDRDTTGIWRIDLQASPWRAAENLQQAGTLHASGRVGGTSSRLLPAALVVSWTGASVSDVLRLARSYDYGVRGTLGVSLSARTEAESWILQGRAELRELHRWDLAQRPDNPAVNLIAKMKLSPQASGVEITDAAIEAPSSSARVSGSISWSPTLSTRSVHLAPPTVQLASGGIDLADVLAWVRAFHSNVASDISLGGFVAGNATLAGWPPRFVKAQLTTPGAELAGTRLRVPVRLAETEFHYDGDRMSVRPTTLVFGLAPGPASGVFRIEALPSQSAHLGTTLHVSGSANPVANLIVTAGAFGWNLSRGWTLSGPLRCDLRWRELDGQSPWMVEPVGFLELGSGWQDGDALLAGAALGAPFLNQPIDQIRARADWKPGLHHITLVSAQAFGAHWSGSFDRRVEEVGGAETSATAGQRWQFSLSADHLAAADIDRSLNPRWREGFIDRVLPFLSSRGSGDAVPETLRADGHLSLDQFGVDALLMRHLQADLKVDGRHLELTDAKAQLSGGNIDGSFAADLKPVPVYRVTADFAGVDLSSLTASSDQVSGLFDGSASGNISFDASGASRSDLLASLTCHGAARIKNAELDNVDFAASVASASTQSGKSLFREASAAFTCRDRNLVFQDLLFVSPQLQMDFVGSASFDRSLNFRFRTLSRDDSVRSSSDASDPPARSFRLTGLLASPQISPSSPPVHPHR